MSCLRLNIFENFADYHTHRRDLKKKLKTFDLDESYIFDLKRQLYHVFYSIKKNNTQNIYKNMEYKKMEYNFF